jgi:hypothetical protein
MKDDKGFVYTGIAFLLAIPVIVLVASLANMMEIGDTTTAMVIRSDSVYYPCEDIQNSFEFAAENYAEVYRNNVTGIQQRFRDRWLPQILAYFDDAGINVDISSINITHDVSTNSIELWSEDPDKGINITITDEKGSTKCDVTSGPLSINVGEDTSGPDFLFLSPENRTLCEPPLILELSYRVSEPTINETYSIDGGSNMTANSGITIQINDTGPHYLTLYGTDAFNNNGSETLYLYVKNWTYVNYSINSSGIVTSTSGNIDPVYDARDPDDGDESANMTEVFASATSSDNFPENRAFVSDSNAWDGPINVTSGITNDWTGAEGNPVGSIYTQAPATNPGTVGNGTWESEFNYSTGPPDTAHLSFDYMITKSSGQAFQGTNRFRIQLIDPDKTNTYDLYTVTFTSDSGGWVELENNPIDDSYFTKSGNYTLRILTELSMKTNKMGTVYFDNVNIVLTESSSDGFQHSVYFTTIIPPTEVIDWPGHELQVRYKMGSVDPEGVNPFIYDSSSLDWNVYGPILPNSTAFNVFSHDLELAEYNSGNITVRYTDPDQEDKLNASSFLIDYHRVC